MKKIFCDKCGKECYGFRRGTPQVFDNTVMIFDTEYHLCEQCYYKLYEWWTGFLSSR